MIEFGKKRIDGQFREGDFRGFGFFWRDLGGFSWISGSKLTLWAVLEGLVGFEGELGEWF